MSAVEEEVDGGSSQRHAREEGEALGSRGRPHPGDGGDEQEEEARSCGDAAEDSGGRFSGEEGGTSRKAQEMPSNSSSDTCIPTPSCRICFQGAEQVRRCPLIG